MADSKKVLAVVVLYKMRAEESTAFQSLTCALRSVPGATAEMDLMVCDNTPTPQAAPEDFRGAYVRDPSNPGLAKPYNLALAAAERQRTGWLMLLDQDTTVTCEYVSEMLERVGDLEQSSEICAIVPKLMQDGAILSPHVPPFTESKATVTRDLSGLPEIPLHIFNSGAVLRVRALRAIGGFPQRFWLDYLDHATFHLLQATGDRIFVLQSELAHRLSVEQLPRQNNPSSAARHASMLRGASLFYRKYGSAGELRSFRRSLVRQAAEALKRGWYRRAAQLLRTAFASR